MPTTTTKFVAFVDILGFSEIIKSYDAGENQEILNLLKKAVDPAAGFLRNSFELAKGEVFYEWKDCLDTRLFSDCLCAAAPLEFKDHDFIKQLTFFYKYVIGYQWLLMANGFFTRGGVTIGSHYADENMIFSGGLVEAHQLECEMAIYPRVIISEYMADKLKSLQAGNEEILNYMLAIDHKGIAFFNPFNITLIDAAMQDAEAAALTKAIGIDGILGGETFFEKDQRNKANFMSEIQQRCEQIIATNANERIQAKYRWLMDFIEYERGNNNNFKAFIN